MTTTHDQLLDEQRAYLSANNGIKGLEVLDPSEVDRAVRIFNRDGFVVVHDALTADELAFLKAGVDAAVHDIVSLDPDRKGNRGSHRYSFGGSSLTRSMLHRPEWQMLIDLPTVTPIITAIFQSSDYLLRSCSGDFCLPGATQYQPLHSDMRDFLDPTTTPFSSFHDPRNHLSTRDLPCPYVCVNVLTVDSTPLNGPTRQIPGSQHSRAPVPTLSEEPEWMRLSTVCPAPAGSVQIRDVRAWHGAHPMCPTTCGRFRTSSSTRRGSGSRCCRGSPKPTTDACHRSRSGSPGTAWRIRPTISSPDTR